MLIHKEHKYYKQKTPRGKHIYRCGISGCPHFVYEALISGRISECWRCGNYFTVTRANLRTKYFHCVDCTKKRVVSENLEAVDKLIDSIMKGEIN